MNDTKISSFDKRLEKPIFKLEKLGLLQLILSFVYLVIYTTVKLFGPTIAYNFLGQIIYLIFLVTNLVYLGIIFPLFFSVIKKRAHIINLIISVPVYICTYKFIGGIYG